MGLCRFQIAAEELKVWCVWLLWSLLKADVVPVLSCLLLLHFRDQREHPSETGAAFSGQELLFLCSNADRNGCQRTGLVNWTWQVLAVFCTARESGISHRKTQVSFSKYYSKIPSRGFVNKMALVFSRAFLFQPCNSKHTLEEQESGEIHESGLE